MINVSSICSTLGTAIKTGITKPASAIAGIIMLCGLMKRPGLSTILTVAAIATKMGKYGLPTGEFEDGTPNHMLQFTRIVVDEVYKNLRENAKISTVLAPGSITVQAGPYVGTNTNIVQGDGVMF